ncbi:MAG: alpha/beta hydrolase [Archaeoglobaceae archaeon]
MEKKVSFTSHGIRMRGDLHVPYNSAPCIIALHGLEGDKDRGKWPAVASYFYESGFACLRFNFRGCGENEKSDGSFEDLTLSGRIEDYNAALNYVRSEQSIDRNRIGVIGSSMGGMVAIGGKQKVNAVVTMGSPYKVPRYGKPLIPQKEGDHYVLPSGSRFKKDFYQDLQKYDLTKDVKQAPPLMIIHGSSDEIVPVEHAQILYDSAVEPKTLQIIEGADHTFSNPSHLDKALSAAVEWFNKYV